MPHPDRTRAHLAVAAACLVLSLAAFGRAIPGGFVSDDTNAIVANRYVSGHASASQIFTSQSWWSAERADAPGYRPLVTWSFAINHAWSGGSPHSFHVVNILAHVGVCLLLYALSLALGFSLKASAASALLFAVLPIHSEAVIWIVGRAELMAALGFLGCTIAGLAFARGANPTWLALSSLCLLAGILSKENAVTAAAAPGIAWLWLGEAGQDDDAGHKAWRNRNAVWFAALCAALLVYVLMRPAAGDVLGGGSTNTLDNVLAGLPWLQRQAAALSVLGRYLWLSVVPWGLSVDYSFNSLSIGQEFWADRYSLLGLAGLSAALGTCAIAIRSPAWRPHAVMCALSLAAFSIVSNTVFVIGTAMGERLFYLPSIALCTAAGGLYAAAHEATPRIAAPIAAAVLMVFTLVCVDRCGDWMTATDLFSAAVADQPRSARAHMELASAYGRDGRPELALEHFGQALAIKPDYAAAAFNRANMLARAGRLDEAIASYELALAALPDWGSAAYNLALVRRMTGDNNGALQALERRPAGSRASAVESLRGEILLGLGRNDEAVEAFTLAMSAGAEPAVALINRGVARERLAGCAAALEDYLAAAQIPGAPAAAANNAANCRRVLTGGP